MLIRTIIPRNQIATENIARYATRFFTFITAVTPKRNKETANKPVSI